MTDSSRKPGDDPLLVQYTNLLHAYGAGSAEAERFRERYKDDVEFQRRAEVLEQIVGNKDILAEAPPPK